MLNEAEVTVQNLLRAMQKNPSEECLAEILSSFTDDAVWHNMPHQPAIYHGAFAPRGRCHSGPVVVDDAPSRAPTPANGSPGAAPAPEAEATPAAAYVRPRYFAWADLLRRVFALDILACPDCGGRLRLLATIEDRAVVEKILTHLGLPADLPLPSAARTPEWLPGVREAADHEDHAGGLRETGQCLFCALDAATRPALSMLSWGQGDERLAGNVPRWVG